MLVEGKNPVRELVEGWAKINKLFVQNNLRDNQSNQIIQRAKERKIRIDFVNKDFLDKKSVTKRHQGFICDTVEFAYSDIDEILDYANQKEESPFLVILDSIEDPHNLGAIIRTCECAGVHGIIIPRHRACQVNETVIRTSAGATSNMKIASVTNLNQTIEVLKVKKLYNQLVLTSEKALSYLKFCGTIPMEEF